MFCVEFDVGTKFITLTVVVIVVVVIVNAVSGDGDEDDCGPVVDKGSLLLAACVFGYSMRMLGLSADGAGVGLSRVGLYVDVG